MPAVSLTGKKFNCDAQFEAGDGNDGNGLQLNLRVQEMCKKYLKPHGPVLATLHVSVTNGSPDDVTKCKELLGFLKDQVFPKILKLINLTKIKNMKDEEKDELGVSWLSCIPPGKKRKRKDETRTNLSRGIQTTRGHCSDTENYIHDCRGQSNLPGVEAQYQASNASILATPMLARQQFLHKTRAKENKKRNVQDKSMPIKCSLTKIGKEKGKTRNFATPQKSDTKELHPNFDSNLSRSLHTKNDQGKGKHSINLGSSKTKEERVDPQCVQNEQSDCYSCSDISASDSFIGFYLSKTSTEDNNSSKIGNLEYETLSSRRRATKHIGSIEMGTRSASTLLGSDTFSLDIFATQKQSLQSSATTIVGRICEVAFSRCVKKTTKDIAMKFVAEIVLKAKNKLIQQKELKPLTVNRCYEEENGEILSEEVKSPSFSKVWKYSRSFPTEMFESFKINDSLVRDKDCDMCSRSKEDGNVESKNDCQFEEFLERKLLESLESSYQGMPMQSLSLSSDKLSDFESQDKDVRCTRLEKGHAHHFVDKELFPHHSVVSTENNIQRSSEVSSGFGIHRATYEQAIQGETENLALINQALQLKGSLVLHDSCKETENTYKAQTDVKCCSEKTEDCHDKNFDFNSKESEDDLMFGSDASDNIDLTNTGSLIPEEKRSENSFGNEPFSFRRFLYKRTVSESQASERKQWSALKTEDSNLDSLHSSTLPCNFSLKYFRSSSCPVVSEDDVLFENMLSHHRDVYDSLSRRTWIILHVHKLWNSGKPIDAIKTCINLTGMADAEQETSLYSQESRDYALFLNILQQLPSSCSMWSLDLFVLILPKLKGFISAQHHASHVEMASGIIHVVLKKVAIIIRRTSKANKNKDKEMKVKSCTNELKEIKDMTTEVIQAVKSGNKSSMGDPGSMILVLKELQLALETFF